MWSLTIILYSLETEKTLLSQNLLDKLKSDRSALNNEPWNQFLYILESAKIPIFSKLKRDTAPVPECKDLTILLSKNAIFDCFQNSIEH